MECSLSLLSTELKSGQNTEFDGICCKKNEMDDNQVIKSSVKMIGKQSPYLQIALGTGGGIVTGFVLLKTFKVVSIFLGGIILTMELAVQAELIDIQWEAITKCFESSSFNDNAVTRRQPPDPLQQIKSSMINSARFSVAFLAGFLIGMGFS